MSNKTSQPALQSIPEPSAREQRLAKEVMEFLNRWDKRLQGHNREKRLEDRNPYQTQIMVCVPPTPALPDGTPEHDARCLKVWARNLSGNGIGIIYRGHLACEDLIVCLEPGTEELHWYSGKFVRARPVQNEFWEYGIQLTGAVEYGQAASALGLPAR